MNGSEFFPEQKRVPLKENPLPKIVKKTGEYLGREFPEFSQALEVTFPTAVSLLTLLTRGERLPSDLRTIDLQDLVQRIGEKIADVGSLTIPALQQEVAEINWPHAILGLSLAPLMAVFGAECGRIVGQAGSWAVDRIAMRINPDSPWGKYEEDGEVVGALAGGIAGTAAGVYTAFLLSLPE